MNKIKPQVKPRQVMKRTGKFPGVPHARIEVKNITSSLRMSYGKKDK